MSIAGSLLYGFANLLHPRMLWLMLWPMLVSLAVWGTVAIVLWVRTAVWLAGLIQQLLQSVPGVAAFDLASAALIAAHVLLFLAFVPLVYLTAIFILGIFGMQAMVDHVARRSFPALERRRGGSAFGSVWNGFLALAGMLLMFLVSLPLWLAPPLWPVLAVAILGWGNQRLLRYDALAEHADGGEMQRLFGDRQRRLYAMGVLLALTAYIPFVGFLAPVAFGLAFIHYLLGALAAQRIESGYRADPNKELDRGNAPP
jgi:CysZ protein